MLNSKIYNPDKVWMLISEVYKKSVDSDQWSFREICIDLDLPQTYGTVINQETEWLTNKRWVTIVPRKTWVESLINRVREYHKNSNNSVSERKLRDGQQELFYERLMIHMSDPVIPLKEALVLVCDELVIFKNP